MKKEGSFYLFRCFSDVTESRRGKKAEGTGGSEETEGRREDRGSKRGKGLQRRQMSLERIEGC